MAEAKNYTVIKPFKSLNRRFAVGDKITSDDIDAGGAHSAEDWALRGFLEEAKKPSEKVKANMKADTGQQPSQTAETTA